ncbi:T9SS type A sorting domain-containing protein [bacterium]|nr:T9SS type A sorting domain-containing protein [bacterium]
MRLLSFFTLFSFSNFAFGEQCLVNYVLTGQSVEINETTEGKGNEVSMGNASFNCLDGFNSTGPDYFVAFTPPATAKYDFALDNFSFDAQLYILTSCDPINCLVGRNTTSFHKLAVLDYQLTANQTYVVGVDGWQSSDYGAFRLRIGQNILTFGEHLSDNPSDFLSGINGADIKKVTSYTSGANRIFEIEFYNQIFAPSVAGTNASFLVISVDADKNQATGNTLSYSDKLKSYFNVNNLGCDLFLDVGTYINFNGVIPVPTTANISDNLAIFDQNWNKTATLNAVTYNQNSIVITLDNSYLGGNIDFNYAVGAEKFLGSTTIKDISPEWGRINTVLPSETKTDGTNKPTTFFLSQNYPNPFNPSTTINYDLGIYEEAKLTIFNVKGEKIKEFSLEKTKNFVVWNGTNQNGKLVSSGIYFYSLQVANLSQTKKMLFLK